MRARSRRWTRTIGETPAWHAPASGPFPSRPPPPDEVQRSQWMPELKAVFLTATPPRRSRRGRE
eukprot:scaffold502_cov115-Isochrysis_galbana.AAC.16